MPYQPETKIQVEVNQLKLVRPAPTNPGSLRCRLGFHNFVEFEIRPSEVSVFSSVPALYRKFPKYCTRCDCVEQGRRMPSSFPPKLSKPKQEDRKELTEEEYEYLQSVLKPTQGDRQVFTYVKQTEPNDLGCLYVTNDEAHDISEIIRHVHALLTSYDKDNLSSRDIAAVDRIVRTAIDRGAQLRSNKFILASKPKGPENQNVRD